MRRKKDGSGHILNKKESINFMKFLNGELPAQQVDPKYDLEKNAKKITRVKEIDENGSVVYRVTIEE